jgi:hypothetical protein
MKNPDFRKEAGLNGTSVPSVEMAPMVAVSDYPICFVYGLNNKNPTSE